MARGAKHGNDRGGRNGRKDQNRRNHRDLMDLDSNQGSFHNRHNNRNNRGNQNQPYQNNGNKHRKGRNNMNHQSNESLDRGDNHFNNNNVANNNHYQHKQKNNHSRNHRNRHGNDKQDSNGYSHNFNQPNGPGQYVWVPEEAVDDRMTEARDIFSEEAGLTILPAPNSPIGSAPRSPIDVIMLDASTVEAKTSWRQRNDNMISMLYEKKPPGLNGDLTVIRHALDNMDKDFSNFLRASMREDANGDELGVNLQVLQLHLSLWVHYFESDSAEIYALRNGFNPSCLGQDNIQQVPMIVGWFASDSVHSQEAYRGFVLLWSKSGAKRSRQLGLATVCQLFIQSLSRPELLVPKHQEPNSPVSSPRSFFEKPFKTVGSILNPGPR